MKTYLEERRSNVNPFHPIQTYPDRLTTLPPIKSQAPQERKAGDVKKRSRNHQAGRRQYNVRRIENPSTSVPGTTAATIITPTASTTSNSINPVIATSTWPTSNSTTTNIFVSSNSSKTLILPNAPKPQTSSQTPRSWPRPYNSASFTDWSPDDNCNGTKQKEREKINKVQRREWRQLAEEERRTKEEQNTTPHISNAPDFINPKPKPTCRLNHKEDTLIPVPVKEKKQKIRKLVMSKFKTPAATKAMSCCVT